jgi:oligopeptide transport system permease protein
VDETGREQEAFVRESVGFWKESFKRLLRNPLAVISGIVIILTLIIAFVIPGIYPYGYETQIKGAENLGMFEYSADEQAKIAAGEHIFPHIFGTDTLGRDYAIRVMMGSRISLIVGLVASLLVFIIGSIYGAVSGYFGGKVDLVMMRIVDILLTIPDILVIILLSVTLKFPLQRLAESIPGFGWIQTVGVPLVCIFVTFALLYWVGMARLVRGQIFTLREIDYVNASKALGASPGYIIKKHLLPNCMSTLIVATTLQIPSAIFTESFLSFIGIGVSAPLPSLGSLTSAAVEVITIYPSRLIIPALLISIIILSMNLFGDSLRDAFDPKLKK